MKNSSIEWTDHTFNPWIGCTKVSPGCDHCYAEQRMDKRLHVVKWGPGAPRKRTSEKNWNDPVKWNANHEAFFAQHGRRQRVFCASLADVFDNEVDPGWRQDLFDLIASTPNLDWLLLTKRIGNAADMINAALLDDGPQWPWPNVWIGISIVNQVEADRDIPKLLRVPAAKRFLSCEPLLAALKVWKLTALDFEESLEGAEVYPLNGIYAVSDCDWPGPKLDWVIVGGESGPGARPMHPDWVRSLRDQCKNAGVPFFFKQWGEFMPPESRQSSYPAGDWRDVLDHGGTTRRIAFVGDRVLESSRQVVRVGKKAAGRLLDGETWSEVPA